MNSSSVGSRIRKEREAAGITQAELASRIGTAAAMIGQWENNNRNPKAAVLEKIAAALNISVDRLLYDSVVKTEVLPGRAWVIQIDDPSLDNYIYRLEASDPEAFAYVQNIMANVVGDIQQFTPEARLAVAFNQLNEAGRAIAIQRIEELAKIPDYRAAEDEGGNE